MVTGRIFCRSRLLLLRAAHLSRACGEGWQRRSTYGGIVIMHACCRSMSFACTFPRYTCVDPSVGKIEKSVFARPFAVFRASTEDGQTAKRDPEGCMSSRGPWLHGVYFLHTWLVHPSGFLFFGCDLLFLEEAAENSIPFGWRRRCLEKPICQKRGFMTTTSSTMSAAP